MLCAFLYKVELLLNYSSNVGVNTVVPVEEAFHINNVACLKVSKRLVGRHLKGSAKKRYEIRRLGHYLFLPASHRDNSFSRYGLFPAQQERIRKLHPKKPFLFLGVINFIYSVSLRPKAGHLQIQYLFC